MVERSCNWSCSESADNSWRRWRDPNPRLATGLVLSTISIFIILRGACRNIDILKMEEFACDVKDEREKFQFCVYC